MPKAVICLLEINGKILILKRSDKVSTYKGLWSGISGYVEHGENPYDAAIKEIREEVGIEAHDLELIKKEDPVHVKDVYKEKIYEWTIFPFIFKTTKKNEIHIDWENIEYKWILPEEIKEYKTVPYLKEIISKLYW
jgi:8-oxo-dGTP pyrophosphatase MutT (NUDIX family)